MAVGVLASLAGCAEPDPAVLDPTFVDAPSRAAAAKVGPACPLQVAELRDARHAPDTLGRVGYKVVKAPVDREAWLRSIVAGLGERGFKVVFTGPAAPGVITARIVLQTAWVTDTSVNMSANVVLHVEAMSPAGAQISRDYRGAVSGMNWATTDGEVRGVVDKAFARALGALAVDLKPLCAA